ncbi:lycopene cyclase domain-containing protein [Chitinophaga polysaccharea]|uniref:Lycopene cyclase domain-containing protein n=1 Tax=Chitinophaga polysaccharea TaxID=1293035 RepID=A0A561PXX0_9BACT|nr:lycopene cyclase domain-containing protein [Chitinophaga polysaccharea]
MWPYSLALSYKALYTCYSNGDNPYLTLTYLHFIARKEWIGSASLVYFILMPGFFIVNGILTGTGINSPIVNYNPEEILNVRLLTIPVEDTVYGYAQFLLVIYFFKQFQNRHNEK